MRARRGTPVSMTMSEARAAFAKVLKRAEEGEPVEVTRGGRPVAIVVSVEQFRKAQGQLQSPSQALRAFMAKLDRRVLGDTDPWVDVRGRSPGREVDL